MKKIGFLLLTVTSLFAVKAQTVQLDTIFIDDISIRAIEIWDSKVWYVGTQSKFGYVDLENKDSKRITLSESPLQFRTLGQDDNFFYTINIESPAYFFKIKKSDLSFEIIHKDKDSTAFYDALHFFTHEKALTFSDPEKDKKLKILYLSRGVWSKVAFGDTPSIYLASGEAAFAASNTNIVSKGRWIWLATGGKESNIYKFCKKNFNKIYKYKTPIVQGENTQGIYSIDFYNQRLGIAVGGDYTKPDQNYNTIIATEDGGKTWSSLASGHNAGYSTYVGYAPHSRGEIIVTLGDHHISISMDKGRTWKIVSNEKGFYTAKWIDKFNLVLAGKNKIAKMRIIY